jgi:hypothetical protein
VLEVKLHEAAHALATQRGIKDTSAAGNRYHNKRFAALAAELGLRSPDTPDKITGWSSCTLTDVAEYLDLSLGDLVDGIVLHAFEGKTPLGPPILTKIDQLKAVYGLTLTAADAHKLTDQP